MTTKTRNRILDTSLVLLTMLVLLMVNEVLSSTAFAQSCSRINGPRVAGGHTYNQYDCHGLGDDGSGTVYALCTDGNCAAQVSQNQGTYVDNNNQNGIACSLGWECTAPNGGIGTVNLGPIPPGIQVVERFFEQQWGAGGPGCGDDRQHDEC